MNSQHRWLVFPLSILLISGCVRAADSVQSINLDGSAQGKLFEGIGAVSGGGATSVLLKDYPEPQRSQILDLLFKPQFGASMQVLYVEVGGDGNSTQGSEPTHMRTRTDQNYSRGYEWWLMSQAVKRNPSLALDGCAWGCPGWVGDGNFWSADMADYYVKWIQGLKSHYGLPMSAIGCRNERGAVTGWVKLFRKALDASGLQAVRIHGFDNPGNRSMWDWIPQLQTDKDLAASIDVVSNHTLLMGPYPSSVRRTVDQFQKPVWDTEEHVYNGEGRYFADDYECAIGAVHLFNADFISRDATRIVNWYLVGSTYGIEPYSDQPPALFARWPWSGHYEIKPIIWAYAHYGQFTQIGWHYVPGGRRELAGGGTVVTLKSPSGDYSIIAETRGATQPQTLTFAVAPGLSKAPLCVWRTTREAYFARQEDITPSPADSTFSVTLLPDAIYSFSTTRGQQKGDFSPIPPIAPFPFPYRDNFDHYGNPRSWGYLPHFTADICGVFELADAPDGSGPCLRQVVARKAQSWAPEWMPYTILGDDQWTDYEVGADLYFDDDGWAGLMGRVTNTGNGWEDNPNGYYVRLYPDGGCALYVASDRLRGHHERELAIGAARRTRGSRWRNLKLRFQGEKITVLVDNLPVITANDDTYDHGLAGLITGGEGDARNTACFRNLIINRPEGGPVAPTSFTQNRDPIYRSVQ